MNENKREIKWNKNKNTRAIEILFSNLDLRNYKFLNTADVVS